MLMYTAVIGDPLYGANTRQFTLYNVKKNVMEQFLTPNIINSRPPSTGRCRVTVGYILPIQVHPTCQRRLLADSCIFPPPFYPIDGAFLKKQVGGALERFFLDAVAREPSCRANTGFLIAQPQSEEVLATPILKGKIKVRPSAGVI